MGLFKSQARRLQVAIENPAHFEEKSGYHGYWLPFHGALFTRATAKAAAEALARTGKGDALVNGVMIYHQGSFAQMRTLPWTPESHLAAIPDFAQSSLQLIEVEAEDPARRVGAGFTALMIYVFLTLTAKEMLKGILEASRGRKDRCYVLGFDVPSLALPPWRKLEAGEDQAKLWKRSIAAPTIELTEFSVSPWRSDPPTRDVGVLRALTLR